MYFTCRADSTATAKQTQGGSTHEQRSRHRQPPRPAVPLSTNSKRQTAKDVIAENVKALIAQLEAGKSDALTAYLDAMARFHNYSFGNILAIARQSRPQRTLPECSHGTSLDAA